MNANITRALFADALAQVLDNKVFRLLVILVVVVFLVVIRAIRIKMRRKAGLSPAGREALA